MTKKMRSFAGKKMTISWFDIFYEHPYMFKQINKRNNKKINIVNKYIYIQNSSNE